MPDPESAAAPAGAPATPIARERAPEPQVPRTTEQRAADHREVERLAGDLLPALIARLASSGLAELEVREGGWKVRLRRPLELVGSGRRATDRQVRLQVGTAGQGPFAGPAGGPRATTAGSGTGEGPGRGAREGGREPGRGEARGDGRGTGPAQPVVTSPAVGIFRPRDELRGTTVRSGDRLGIVDMLGIAQDVLARSDGVVGEILAEPGDGVEYGQPLFAIVASRPAPRGEAIPVEAEDQLAAPAGERS